MQPTKKVLVEKTNGMEVNGQLMYVIVWEGKALSGRTRLIDGDMIENIEIEDNNA